MGESSSDSGSDRKRHKSDKKEKKSKKEKKHKKDKKSKHKAEKEPPPSAPGVAAISEADYFEKAAEFRIWLRARGAFLDEIDAAEARKLFVKKFVPRWNAGELDPTLYAGVNETAQSAATRTRHVWGFAAKMSERDRMHVDTTRDSVDTQTQRGAQKVAAAAAAASAPRAGPAVVAGPARPPGPAASRQHEQWRDAVLDEVAPKAAAGSFEAQRAKRDAQTAFHRRNDDASTAGLERGDHELMGGGGSDDFAAARARRDARLGSKASAAAARVAELQAKEDARIAKMKAQLGL